jgi:class 3 adenylate cyclase
LEAHRVERKLSAIFAADVEGYSRLMGRDEVGTLSTLTAYRVIIDRLIAFHRGRIFSTAGDSVLADLASACRSPLGSSRRAGWDLRLGHGAGPDWDEVAC